MTAANFRYTRAVGGAHPFVDESGASRALLAAFFFADAASVTSCTTPPFLPDKPRGPAYCRPDVIPPLAPGSTGLNGSYAASQVHGSTPSSLPGTAARFPDQTLTLSSQLGPREGDDRASSESLEGVRRQKNNSHVIS